MLYGMSLIFGVTGSTLLVRHLARTSARTAPTPLLAVAIFLSLVGFAFKVERGAVPLLGARHLRRRAHAGHRVPVGRVEGRRVRRPASTSSTSASSADGTADAWWPVLWVLAAASMTLGNLAALRQTNIVRMLAYSSIAQGGFMLVPFAAAGIDGARRPRRRRSMARRHLPPHLRRDEPRRVRGGDRGRAAHPQRRDLVVRRAVPDVARCSRS